MKAYLLVRVEAGKENHVLDKIIEIEGVRKASLVFGPYDVVAEVEVTTHDVLDNVVVGGVRKIDGVKDTLTLVVAEEKSK